MNIPDYQHSHEHSLPYSANQKWDLLPCQDRIFDPPPALYFIWSFSHIILHILGNSLSWCLKEDRSTICTKYPPPPKKKSEFIFEETFMSAFNCMPIHQEEADKSEKKQFSEFLRMRPLERIDCYTTLMGKSSKSGWLHWGFMHLLLGYFEYDQSLDVQRKSACRYNR